MKPGHFPNRDVEVYELRATMFAWYYPSWTFSGRCHLDTIAVREYADSPSDELRSLIEAGAPWYAVMDKLSEEYPQWQHHFDEAIRRHQSEQPTSEPQPQEG